MKDHRGGARRKRKNVQQQSAAEITVIKYPLIRGASAISGIMNLSVHPAFNFLKNQADKICIMETIFIFTSDSALIRNISLATPPRNVVTIVW